MDLDNTIVYWSTTKNIANNLAGKLKEIYNSIIDRIESRCGQQVDINWEYSQSFENDSVEVLVKVNREGVHASYTYVGWTRWSAKLPDDVTEHWTCTLKQLERVCGTMTNALDIAQDEIENAAIDALFAGDKPAAVPAAEGGES